MVIETILHLMLSTCLQLKPLNLDINSFLLPATMVKQLAGIRSGERSMLCRVTFNSQWYGKGSLAARITLFGGHDDF